MNDEAQPSPVDHLEASQRTRGYLPHWEHSNAIYFVTFRLADALPQEVLERYKNERDAVLARLQAR